MQPLVALVMRLKQGNSCKPRFVNSNPFSKPKPCPRSQHSATVGAAAPTFSSPFTRLTKGLCSGLSGPGSFDTSHEPWRSLLCSLLRMKVICRNRQQQTRQQQTRQQQSPLSTRCGVLQ